jgi:hypothetical protein
VSAELPSCPVCGFDDLRLLGKTLENGDYHIEVGCGSCGIRMQHESFWAYNAVVKFFEDEDALRTCENTAPLEDDDDRRRWSCSNCKSARTIAEGEKPYSHCPDCGCEVVQW